MSAQQKGKHQARMRHPLFPVVCFVLVSLIVKEEYPFSHFSMYSRLSGAPLRFHYLADSTGQPLPVQKHTGMSCATMSKMMGTEKGRIENRDAQPPSLMEIKAQAGRKILTYLRELSLNKKSKRRKKDTATLALPEGLQIVEVLITSPEGKAVETHQPVAKIP